MSDLLDALDRACSRFREDSELAALNAAAGRPTTLSPLLARAIEVALRAARVTDGDVDPTIGTSIRLAGYDRDFSLLTANERRVRFVRAAGWRLVELDAKRGSVRLPAGVELDLGATAKAFASDQAAEAVSRRTRGGVLVSLGGDVATAGPPPAGGWSVLVTDDHESAPGADGQTVSIRSGGLATSSTTVRRWGEDRRLHHILDPGSGRPAPEVWRTVSVAAGSCVDANTASTAAIIRGARAPDWLRSAGLPARLVACDGAIVTVGGWPAADAHPR